MLMPFVGFENTTQLPTAYGPRSAERMQEFAQYYGHSEETNPTAGALSP